MRQYYALTIDLIQSRTLNLTERNNAQNRYKMAMDLLNNVYSEGIIRKFAFTSGDSIQSLFGDIESAFLAFTFMQAALCRYRLRGGIGIGSINEYIASNFIEDTNANDGLAYHNARAALDIAKKNNLSLYICSDNKQTDELMSYFINDLSPDVFSSTNRKLVFSLLYLLKPVLSQKCLLNSYYYQDVVEIMHPILEEYLLLRHRHRFAPHYIKEDIFVEKSDIFAVIMSNLDGLIAESNNKLMYEFDHKGHISALTRRILFKLIRTSESNINMIISSGRMNGLFKKIAAQNQLIKQQYFR